MIPPIGSLTQHMADKGDLWHVMTQKYKLKPVPYGQLVAWPFAAGRLQGEAAAHASAVNKALVAFFACLIVAVSAISVATNLARVPR